jgi:hypothetical protein
MDAHNEPAGSHEITSAAPPAEPHNHGPGVSATAEKPRFRVTAVEIAIFLLVINLCAVAALYVKTERDKAPIVATVGVTALARNYEAQFANDPNATPELVKLKTSIFMGSAEQAVKTMSQKQHMVILARECVLAGEAKDLTPDLQQIIDTALKKSAVQQGAASNDADPFHVQ